MPTLRDLFFWLPKLLDFVEQPLTWVFVLLVVALVLFRRGRDRSARRTIVAAAALLATLGLVALPEMILQRLENAYPATTRPFSDFEGVIVLGGGIEGGRKPIERGQLSLSSAAERVTTVLSLARSAPELKIVLAGYAGVSEPGGLTEAEGTLRFFQEQGVPNARVSVDPVSRNTAETATNISALPGIDRTKPWLLLTSAWHMPRAFQTFKKAGWNVEPLPVDYLTGTTIRYFRYSISAGAGRWNVALHELLGMGWYRLTGRL